MSLIGLTDIGYISKIFRYFRKYSDIFENIAIFSNPPLILSHATYPFLQVIRPLHTTNLLLAV